MEVVCHNEIAQKAKIFLDTLQLVYFENSKIVQKETNANTEKYIQEQIANIENELGLIQDSLQTYRDTNNVLNYESEFKEYFRLWVSSDELQRSLKSDLISIDSLVGLIAKTEGNRVLAPSIIVLNDDIFLQEELRALNQDQIELENLNGFTNNSNFYTELESKISTRKKEIIIYLKSTKSVINSRYKEALKQRQKYAKKVKDIPHTKNATFVLERKKMIDEKMHNFLLEKKINTEIAAKSIVAQATSVEDSRVIGLVSPLKKRIITMFMLGGVVFAAVLAFIKQTFFLSIENISQLKKYANVPVLGDVYFVNNKEEFENVILTDPKSNVSESFRILRTNLQYFNSELKNQTLLVTSYHPGEGKTF